MCWIHSLIFRNRRGHDTRAHSMFRIYAYMCNTMVLCRHALNAGPYAALLGGFAHISEHVTRTSGMLTCSAFDTFMCTSVKHAFGASETCILVTCPVDNTWWCHMCILYACIGLSWCCTAMLCMQVIMLHSWGDSHTDVCLHDKGRVSYMCVFLSSLWCSFDTHKPFV